MDQVKDFQNKLADFLAARKGAVLVEVRDEKAISNAIGAELKAAVEGVQADLATDGGDVEIDMPSTRDIRRRIKSIKNTAQITKAMQMVAAAKMRKAQQAALVGRPYAQLLNDIMSEAVTRTVGFDHPLMQSRPVAKRRWSRQHGWRACAAG